MVGILETKLRRGFLMIQKGSTISGELTTGGQCGSGPVVTIGLPTHPLHHQSAAFDINFDIAGIEEILNRLACPWVDE